MLTTVTDDGWYQTIWKILVSLEECLSVLPENKKRKIIPANGRAENNFSYDSQNL